MNERALTVTRHAVVQFGRRLNDKRPHHLIEKEIKECVALGLERGLVFTERPPGFLLYGRQNSEIPEGQRFVQCDKSSQFGFIVKRHTDPAEGDVVVTTLTRAGVRQ